MGLIERGMAFVDAECLAHIRSAVGIERGHKGGQLVEIIAPKLEQVGCIDERIRFRPSSRRTFVCQQPAEHMDGLFHAVAVRTQVGPIALADGTVSLHAPMLNGSSDLLGPHGQHGQ